MKNFGKSSRGHTQGPSKIFRVAIYRAHRVVIFMVALLSCYDVRMAVTSPWRSEYPASVCCCIKIVFV